MKNNYFNYEDYFNFADVLSLAWSTVGKIFIPALLPWFIYHVYLSQNQPDLIGKQKKEENPQKDDSLDKQDQGPKSSSTNTGQSEFEGKLSEPTVVLITGASSGLGEKIAHVFYKNGCKVILTARRRDELERVKNELLGLRLTRTTFTPEILQLDLSDLGSITKKATEALAIHGYIDILINNAGVSHRGTAISTDIDIKIMTVNFFGTIALTKAVLPSMTRKKQGHIVAISSVQGRLAVPFRSAYAASKHALQGFMDCLRSEVKAFGILVTVISPGYVRTNLSMNALTGTGDSYGRMDENTNAGYDPEAVAKIIYSSIAKGKKESIIAPLAPKLAILLRTICPSLYFLIMSRRAKQ